MKIYTKKGDKGNTSLLGGKVVPKNHLKIIAYGTVDELNAYLGLVRIKVSNKAIQDNLIKIQNELFTIGSNLAVDSSRSKIKIPLLTQEMVADLELKIDDMNNELPEIKSFLLPGGNEIVALCHIARCVCRRAERHIVTLDKVEKIQSELIKYLNRLSDYLFTLSRFLTKELKAQEIPWNHRA